MQIITDIGKETGFPGGASGTELACHARDAGSIPGSGRSLGEGIGNLENPMDRGAWWAIAHRVAKIQTRLKPHTHTHTHTHTEEIKNLRKKTYSKTKHQKRKQTLRGEKRKF